MGKRVLSSTNKLPPELGGFPIGSPNKSFYFDGNGVVQLEDRIEDAVWTPGVTAAVPGDLTSVVSTATGRYDKRGRGIDLYFTLVFTLTYTTASGEFRITGLPFAADSGVTSLIPFQSGTGFVWPGTGTQLFFGPQSGQTFGVIQATKSGSGSSVAPVTLFTSGTSYTLRFRGRYRSAA